MFSEENLNYFNSEINFKKSQFLGVVGDPLCCPQGGSKRKEVSIRMHYYKPVLSQEIK